MKPIHIQYFSDMLCIWAYVSQRRIDELLKNYADEILIDYHFCQVFGNAPEMINNGWKERGGVAGFQNALQSVADQFEHIEVHPDVWINDPPESSMSCHLFLRAVQQLESGQAIDQNACANLMHRMREALFAEARNISKRSVQFEIAESFGLPLNKIEEEISSGRAYAGLSADHAFAKQYQVETSPTLIFNEGRQRLIGNVGYRVIEANVRELLDKGEDELSWC